MARTVWLSPVLRRVLRVSCGSCPSSWRLPVVSPGAFPPGVVRLSEKKTQPFPPNSSYGNLDVAHKDNIGCAKGCAVKLYPPIVTVRQIELLARDERLSDERMSEQNVRPAHRQFRQAETFILFLPPYACFCGLQSRLPRSGAQCFPDWTYAQRSVLLSSVSLRFPV